VLVANLAGIVAIDGGRNCNLALKSDGTVWSWGDNTYGQLGIGSFGGTRATPVKVSNLAGVVAVFGSGRGRFNLALKADGTVWAWGRNEFGQLGDGTFTDRNRSVRVLNLPAPIALVTGPDHGLALAVDGTLWTLGAQRFRPARQWHVHPGCPVRHPDPGAGSWPLRGRRHRRHGVPAQPGSPG
jgi:alpha-tubulin suppressor-like RCC1 family protein